MGLYYSSNILVSEEYRRGVCLCSFTITESIGYRQVFSPSVPALDVCFSGSVRASYQRWASYENINLGPLLLDIRGVFVTAARFGFDVLVQVTVMHQIFNLFPKLETLHYIVSPILMKITEFDLIFS